MSATHFELGFSVRLNCHVGKKGEGTERCISPQKLYCSTVLAAALENDLALKVGCKAAQDGGGFGGGIMNYHGSKQKKLEQRGQKFKSVAGTSASVLADISTT